MKISREVEAYRKEVAAAVIQESWDAEWVPEARGFAVDVADENVAVRTCGKRETNVLDQHIREAGQEFSEALNKWTMTSDGLTEWIHWDRAAEGFENFMLVTQRLRSSRRSSASVSLESRKEESGNPRAVDGSC